MNNKRNDTPVPRETRATPNDPKLSDTRPETPSGPLPTQPACSLERMVRRLEFGTDYQQISVASDSEGARLTFWAGKECVLSIPLNFEVAQSITNSVGGWFKGAQTRLELQRLVQIGCKAGI